jgi:hypothetical protein
LKVVNVLYQENDWVYVIGEDQREGFIPHSYCAPYTPHLGEMTLTVKKKLPRDLGIPNATDINNGSAGGPGGGGGGGGGSTSAGVSGNNGGGEGTNQHNTTINSTRRFFVCKKNFFLEIQFSMESILVVFPKARRSSHREPWRWVMDRIMRATVPSLSCRPTVPSKVCTGSNRNNSPAGTSNPVPPKVSILNFLTQTFTHSSRYIIKSRKYLN